MPFVTRSQAEEEEDKLAKTGDVHDDPSLVQYLERIAARVLPREGKAAEGPAIRVIVFRDPTLNAFAMPNGRVYLHTGLLARVENEAQLAAVMAHELTHVTDRHALTVQRETRTRRSPFTDDPGTPVSRTRTGTVAELGTGSAGAIDDCGTERLIVDGKVSRLGAVRTGGASRLGAGAGTSVRPGTMNGRVGLGRLGNCCAQ